VQVSKTKFQAIASSWSRADTCGRTDRRTHGHDETHKQYVLIPTYETVFNFYHLGALGGEKHLNMSLIKKVKSTLEGLEEAEV
jgi:hypothetical protein